MIRPFVVLYVTASVDGRITLEPDKTMFDMDERYKVLGSPEEWVRFEQKIEDIYHPQFWMEGSHMVVRQGEPLRELPSFQGPPGELYDDYLPAEVVEDPKRESWLGIVDGLGRFRNGYKGEPSRPLLHLTSYQAPPEYLYFLRQNKTPYMVSGPGPVDLMTMLQKIRVRLGVTCVATSSGGRLSGALMRLGLIDEINIRMNPVIIGGFKTPSLFDSPELKPGEWPVSLEKIGVEAEGDVLVLRYRVRH
ncbi:dihydrofolate reductase family protein [Candidatus Mcinerneyibacteriota bacterium]|nr:dihydrofolate reductase family protein [Candidatus Mcinerneyibacteriota bacterium]